MLQISTFANRPLRLGEAVDVIAIISESGFAFNSQCRMPDRTSISRSFPILVRKTIRSNTDRRNNIESDESGDRRQDDLTTGAAVDALLDQGVPGLRRGSRKLDGA